MRTHITRITAALLLTLGSTLSAADDTVLSPVKRQQALDRGKVLVAVREVVPLAVDPFYSPAFAEAAAAAGRVSGGPVTTTPANDNTPETVPTPVGPRNDRDLLQAIAKTLTPSGSFIVGNEPLLTFGQKRVKAGGVLTITFEGKQYPVEIVSIDRTTFTLRLNSEEFTRTIK